MTRDRRRFSLFSQPLPAKHPYDLLTFCIYIIKCYNKIDLETLLTFTKTCVNFIIYLFIRFSYTFLLEAKGIAAPPDISPNLQNMLYIYGNIIMLSYVIILIWYQVIIKSRYYQNLMKTLTMMVVVVVTANISWIRGNPSPLSYVEESTFVFCFYSSCYRIAIFMLLITNVDVAINY